MSSERPVDRPELKSTDKCIHVSQSGNRCKHHPIVGARVCQIHGGNSEHVRRAAAERLVLALPEAVAAIVKRIEDDPDAPPCALCGRGMPRDDNVVIKAATAIMDRGGLGPKSEVQVKTVDDTWMKYLSDTELESLINLMETAKSRMPDEERPPQEDESVH